ncbi:GntR family transcriptional regulator [Herbiconiux sp. CPCC 203407]|uniref:GntR family transcriptional regulator n=1 Tax=Herbiconiux oxytropis TaxID=2970915 RepID=A0AA42BWC5_9MICO|nr:GntR family transcriptional regulator [Herbiconiux oxytropis]MCS5723321.1 GntR family transcriptional regulator [Herbiconiux oxytropis]MCS5727864.1 GntR family transcriptional regulator [Herbiconiux oxytropis]
MNASLEPGVVPREPGAVPREYGDRVARTGAGGGSAGAYESLRSAILSLELLPGEGLSERGLEERLAASRTPIRAALMRLENEGLTRRAGRGWQVTPIDLAEVRAVMEYREVIEAAVVGLAVQRADDDELAALRLLAEGSDEPDVRGEAQESSAGSGEAGLRRGGDFHLALARLSRNPFLVEGMADSLTRLSRTRWLEVRTAESRAQARAEHLEIVAAVRARDAGRASALVVAHSRGTRDRLLDHLAEERRRLRGRGFAIIESSETPPAL